MTIEKIDDEVYRSFPDLVSDYLKKESDYLSFFPPPFTYQNLIQSADNRIFRVENRRFLTETLKNQYINSGITISSVISHQLDSLSEGNCFTVTTGHQLNIFTGPLYVIIKILQVIKMADDLNKMNSGKRFIPVYWLASEDHDFEEINHIHLFGQKLTWETDQTGKTGAFNLHSFSKVLAQLDSILGKSDYAHELADIFNDAYLKDVDLTTATRRLIHMLFGDRGLVIVNGDDRNLKTLFTDYFIREFREQVLFENVSQTIKKFSPGYKIQVNPRPINCFYLEDGKRTLIEKVKDGFNLKDGGRFWTEAELLNEVNLFPERFSPNVILRPVYQEVILPNLCYTGGPGEINYWLELKSAFEAFSVPFPLLNLRNSFLILDDSKMQKLEKLQLQVADLFAPENEIIYKLTGFNTIATTLDGHIGLIANEIEKMSTLFSAVDPTLDPMILAEGKKIEKQLYALRDRLLKTVKSKNEERLGSYRKLYEKVFPGGNLHERYDNFVPYFLTHGTSFFDMIYEGINPEDHRLTVLKDLKHN